MKLDLHRLPEDLCPGCGLVGIGAYGTAERGPKAGDLTYCPECGFLSIFGEGLRRRELTPEEEANLPTDLLLTIGELNRKREQVREELQELLG